MDQFKVGTDDNLPCSLFFKVYLYYFELVSLQLKTFLSYIAASSSIYCINFVKEGPYAGFFISYFAVNGFLFAK